MAKSETIYVRVTAEMKDAIRKAAEAVDESDGLLTDTDLATRSPTTRQMTPLCHNDSLEMENGADPESQDRAPRSAYPNDPEPRQSGALQGRHWVKIRGFGPADDLR